MNRSSKGFRTTRGVRSRGPGASNFSSFGFFVRMRFSLKLMVMASGLGGKGDIAIEHEDRMAGGE